MIKRKKLDSRDIGLQIASILGKYFLKTEHLHYGYWPDGLNVNILNLPLAQKHYSDFLLSHIPDNVKNILDVGCGTGENAKFLSENGFSIDGISPSHYQAEKAREKIPSESRIFECFYEDFKTDKKYDLILFSESFQYLKIIPSLEKCAALLNPGGYILICDFFKLPSEERSPMGGGHKLAKFYESIDAETFQSIKNIDITEQTAPNLALVDEALKDVAVPIYKLLVNLLETNYRIIHKMSFLGRLFFRRKITTLQYKYLSGKRNAESFKKHKTYRLLLYKKVKAD